MEKLPMAIAAAPWRRRLTAAGIGCCLAVLAGCAGGNVTPPGPGPTPVPVIVPEPAEVQAACQVAEWALPAIRAFSGQLPARVVAALDVVQAALPACASGNATEAIIDAVAALEQFLNAKGVRPPPTLPRLDLRRHGSR